MECDPEKVFRLMLQNRRAIEIGQQKLFDDHTISLVRRDSDGSEALNVLRTCDYFSFRKTYTGVGGFLSYAVHTIRRRMLWFGVH